MTILESETTTSDPDVDFVALPPGEKIGRYEVLSVLGQGGFGITYRARDIQLEREVAIKEYLPVSLAIRQDGHTVLPRSTKVAEDFTWGRDRFVAEGRTLATLHRAPGIVRVFDFLEFNGTAYIVMELLHGDTLETHLKTLGRLDPDAVERILWTLLDGLEEVHNAGFLHRDIKPANILLDAKGNPTLIDFGASRAAMAGRTVAMTAIFTPGYAAAEQFTSAKQGPWTDIYGLAATLYHAISGATPPSAFDRMLDDSYEPIARHAGPGFSPGLLAGIDAGLTVRASDRPQSIVGWRGILSMTAAPDDAATVMAGHRQPDSAATIVASRPAPPAAASSAPASEPVAAAAESPAAAPTTAPARSRVPLYAGIAVTLLVLAGIGGYFALSPPGPKPPRPGAALQDIKVEDLERVLAERRKADAAAAEKKRLEEEAQQKAETDAAARKAADSELEKAQLARQQAEQELAQMKADMETRRQAEAGQREQAEAVARRAAEEAAQQKAEAEMATLKQAEEDAKLKAAAEAEAQRQADEALAKAQAERQRADTEAKQQAEAEAKQKAESSAKQIAEAEARQKAEAEAQQKAAAEAKMKAEAEAAAAMDKKTAEAAETALNLATPDRQRIQVALTSLGFDTHGYDGAFGPRSRESITAWQKAHSQPATGFLTGTQRQTLLREAAPALSRYDDEQKKIEEEKKKKADDEAKARAAAPVPTAPPPAAVAAPSVAAAAPASAIGTAHWVGQAKCGQWNNSLALDVPVTNGQGAATFKGAARATVTVTISGNRYSGNLSWSPRVNTSKVLSASFSGTISGNTISASLHSRADIAGGPGPNDAPCTIELARTP